MKEANETDYWLLLLKEGNYLTKEQYQSIYPEINEIISLLVSIVKSTKKNHDLEEDFADYEEN